MFDPPFRHYLFSIISKLEPRFELPDETLINELDEMMEVVFFTAGIYSIGYTLNKELVEV